MFPPLRGNVRIPFHHLRSVRNAHRHFSRFIETPTSLVCPDLKAEFSYIWLRDSCPSPDCVHPSTSQKLFRTSDIPLNISPVLGGVNATADGIHIRWSDGHPSFYPRAFLEAAALRTATYAQDSTYPMRRLVWDYSTISKVSDLFLDYSTLNSRSGLLRAMLCLCNYGLLFIRGVPTHETSAETCELRHLARRFGELRETFYGLLWDVQNVRNSRNIAYTNLDLGLHMDLLYFSNPPQYQILHCLRNRVEGGTSYFVDAVAVAERLRETSPHDFDVLTKTLVDFHYVNDGHHLQRSHPTIELYPSTGSVKCVNYSPPFQAPLNLRTQANFYPALKKFADMLEELDNKYSYLLHEGDAVLFDNRRVLHARTAFEDRNEESEMEDGEPNRWLKGCYFEGDALWDRCRVLLRDVS